MCRFSNLAIVRFYRKILALGTSNQLPLPIIDYHRTTGYNRLHKAVINYQQALVVTRYACNRLQIIPNYIYLVFAEPSFLPSLWRCSSFLKLQIIISSSFLNQIASKKAQSSSFPSPPIKIRWNNLKWQNHPRNKRDPLPPPPLQAIAAMEPPETHQHQFLLLFHLPGHPPYFPLMISVRGTTLSFVIELF